MVWTGIQHGGRTALVHAADASEIKTAASCHYAHERQRLDLSAWQEFLKHHNVQTLPSPTS